VTKHCETSRVSWPPRLHRALAAMRTSQVLPAACRASVPRRPSENPFPAYVLSMWTGSK